MIQYPLKELVVPHAPLGNRQPDFYELIVCALYRNAIHLKEGEHDVKANAFIPVNKHMIGNQRVPETDAFLFLGRIELSVAKSGESAFKR